MASSSIPSIISNVTKTLGVAVVGAGLAAQLSTSAAYANEKYAAFVIDANNGEVLFNRYGDDKRYPASLTKMMTLYMLFEALESGRASLSTPMKVSAYAAGRPPSKLGVKTGSTLTVEEAIYSLVTRSANDAAVVIGEFLGGTETRFADMMTAKAHKIGMPRTTFRNANGLPDSGQSTTARDMATLGIALREHFPHYYKYFSTRSFTYRGQKIGNHNRLLGRVEGVDGIKTGYINASGFNLVSSVVRGNKKLVAVVMGGRSGKTRDDHMAKLIAEYLPKASTNEAGPLMAAWTPSSRGPAVTASFATPVNVPVPTLRAESIDQRVALAYGSNAAGAVSAIATPAGRPLVGREALRAALGSMDAAPSLQIPAVHSLAPTGPIPRAPIPGGAHLDPATTGSIARPITAASPWVVQIAATPAEATALEMLAEAKVKGGAALANAEPFTETVDSGSQTLYRARFAGFDSKAAANQACDALKRRSYACYAIAN